MADVVAPVDPTGNHPDAPKLDENGNVVAEIPEVPSVISEEIMIDMKNIWSVFDSENTD